MEDNSEIPTIKAPPPAVAWVYITDQFGYALFNKPSLKQRITYWLLGWSIKSGPLP